MRMVRREMWGLLKFLNSSRKKESFYRGMLVLLSGGCWRDLLDLPWLLEHTIYRGNNC